MTTDFTKKYPRNSLAFHYRFSNLIIASLMVFMLVFSLIYHEYIRYRYESRLTDLTALNNLFTCVENSSSDLTIYHSYLSESLQSTCYTDLQDIRDQLSYFSDMLTYSYSRNLADLYYTTESYLSASEDLLNSLRYSSSDPDSSQALQARYNDTIETASFINQIFEAVYQEQLDSVTLMENTLRTLSVIFNIVLLLFCTIGFFICYKVFQKASAFSDSLVEITHFSNNIISDNAITKDRMAENGPWEIATIAEALNRMLNMIEQYVEKQQEDAHMREQLQAAELENMNIQATLQATRYHLLQSRINPHFLFNTLNMISQTAYLEQAPEAVKIITALSKLLRYNLTQTSESTTIQEELNRLEDYFFIQRYRFGDRICFETSCDSDCLNAIIPNMILQPLVENALQHGAGQRIDRALIRICIEHTETGIRLSVFDNGTTPVSPEEIEQITRHVESPFSFTDTHIGIKNTFYRLKLLFKEEVTFHMTNTPEGTEVILQFPFTRTVITNISEVTPCTQL